MRSLWIFLYLIGVQIGSYYTLGQNFKGYVQTSDMGWFEARRNCIEEGNADMFDPSEKKHLKQSHVVNNTYYWVGGFETSQWRWTDNSPLFTNVGFCDVPTDLENEDIKDIPYNSVLGCYRKCKKYTIGLNGSKCYCFDESDQLTCSEENGNITMCFGNPMDQCGKESSMSVYHVDVPFKLDGDANYQCAYSKLFWHWYGYYNYIELRPYDCDKSLSSICVKEANKNFVRCQNGLCLSPNAAPWTLSNQSCSLAKFSSSKEDDFIDLQWISHFRRYLSWIGLHKQRSRHWVDGKTEQLDFGNSDQDLRCLALMKTDGRWSEHWIPCNESHQSLCSSAEHSDTLDTTTETRSSTGKDNEIPGISSQTTEESQIGEEHASTGNGNGKIGIYVGVSVGCLLVLAVIGIIVVIKRKGLVFFKRREGVKTMTRENISYICPNIPENQDTLHGSRQRGFGDLTTYQNQPCGDSSNEVNTYYNISKAVPVNTGNPNNDFDGARENYDTVHRIDNVDENAYEYIKPHDKKQKFMVDNVEHDVCHQTGKHHVVNVDIGLSRQNVDTYSHLNGSGSDKNALDSGQCYNHLMADAEGDYDVTRPPVVGNAKNQIYSNTSLMGQAQGTDIEVIMPMKDRTAETLSDYCNL